MYLSLEPRGTNITSTGDKSRSEPQKYATIIIDGMDQSKTNLPHFIQCTKSTQNLWKLHTHLTGALLHTKSTKGKGGIWIL